MFFSLLQSITVLSNFSSAGLGSNESIWLTPPSIVRKMQDFAFGVWCGRFGSQRIHRRVLAPRITVQQREAAHPGQAVIEKSPSGKIEIHSYSR